MRRPGGSARGVGHERLKLGVTLLGDVDAMIGRGVHGDRRLRKRDSGCAGFDVPGRMGEGGGAPSEGASGSLEGSRDLEKRGTAGAATKGRE